MLSYYSTLLGCGPVGWESNGTEESVSNRNLSIFRSNERIGCHTGNTPPHIAYIHSSHHSLHYCIRNTHIYFWHEHQQVLRRPELDGFWLESQRTPVPVKEEVS